jgi:hypothetical protein
LTMRSSPLPEEAAWAGCTGPPPSCSWCAGPEEAHSPATGVLPPPGEFGFCSAAHAELPPAGQLPLFSAAPSPFKEPNGSTPPSNKYTCSGSTFVTTTHTLTGITAHVWHHAHGTCHATAQARSKRPGQTQAEQWVPGGADGGLLA